MPFQKGNKGKPKGAKSERIKNWEKLGEMLTSQGAERVLRYLDRCNDETFLKHYMNLLEYFKPKLNRTDITSGDKPIPSPFDGMTFEQLYELKYGRKPD